jgi:hypothetical protein
MGAVWRQREAVEWVQTLAGDPLSQTSFGSAWPRRVVAAALDSTRPTAMSRR